MYANKRPISWHQECLKNRTESFDRKLNLFNRLKDELQRDLNSIIKVQNQIDYAIKNNIAEFDSDKLKVKP